MANTRIKGRMLELKEADEWRKRGWAVEVRHPVRFVGPGRTAMCDFFDRYDLIAASAKLKAVVFIQCSTESPSTHERPLGLMTETGIPDWAFSPNELMRGNVPYPSRAYGVYEVYAYWRKLSGRGWVADRRWYV